MRAIIICVIALALTTAPQRSRRARAPQPDPAPAAARVVRNRLPLKPGAFALLPLGSVRPEGWLKRQLEIQARGLTGRLDEFWPDVGPTSGWLGGSGESWERGPYHLDGLVPLAYLLEDPALIAKAQRYVEWTLTNQADSGWLGPKSNTDWWPNMVMLKVLTHTRRPPAIRVSCRRSRATSHITPGLPPPGRCTTGPCIDGPTNWPPSCGSSTGRPIPRLLDLARTLKAQGTDWRAHFDTFAFQEKTSNKLLGFGGPQRLPDEGMRAHGVNVAMALKTSALWSLVSGEAADRDAATHALDVLDRFHGQPNGMFSADEHHSGRDPSQGTELCAVVESLYSLQHVVATNGDVALADRIERVAYNAMPATMSADMWSHQYDQQANQVMCSLNRRRWVSNGPESNLFGLEPNFGCCTANLHQGWPKLVGSLWMATPDNGLAAVVYAPSTVKARVGAAGQVTIRQVTDYPFSGVVTLTVTPSVNRLRFPLQLRIPSWAEGAAVTLNGTPVADVTPGTFVRIERLWNRGRDGPAHAADACACLDLVSRLGGGGTRAAGLLAARGRGLAPCRQRDEEARASAGRRLGGVADHSMELRAASWGRQREWSEHGGCVYSSRHRAAGGAGALCARRATGRDRSHGTTRAGMAAGGRLGGNAPAKPRHES